MKSPDTSPFALLLITGGLLGAIFPLGKIAASSGVSPVTWSFLISAGTGIVLAASLAVRGKSPGRSWPRLRYFALSGLVSYALPNLLVFLLIPRLGAGFTGLMFTLSPMVTLVLSRVLGIRTFGPLGLAGIAIGFAGAALVVLTRGEAGTPAAPVWLAAALAIPLLLAVGNVYRTLDWPTGAGAIELAAGSHLAAALFLMACGLAIGAPVDIGSLAAVPTEAGLQIAASAAMFVFFFRLQAVGGPTYLSQIGYVAAAVALIVGTLVLGERYGVLTWAGAAIIAIGIALTTVAQMRGD